MMPAVQTIEPETIAIPPGEFLMGCEAGTSCERPAHRVWVDAFRIGKFAVTNSLYRLFVDDANHLFPAGWTDARFSHPDQPVTSVSWYDAVAFCDWLTELTGNRYRLPTEAEWERAARGGIEGRIYTWGDDPPEQQPHYAELWQSAPERVGQRPLVGFGLSDISENVHEWCLDWFDPDYYARSPLKNPQGPASGTRRASRGGSWRHHIKIARVAARSSIPPEYRYSDYGFRVAMTIPPQPTGTDLGTRPLTSDPRPSTPDLRSLLGGTVRGSAIAGLIRLSYNKLPPGGRRKWEARQL